MIKEYKIEKHIKHFICAKCGGHMILMDVISPRSELYNELERLNPRLSPYKILPHQCELCGDVQFIEGRYPIETEELISI